MQASRRKLRISSKGTSSRPSADPVPAITRKRKGQHAIIDAARHAYGQPLGEHSNDSTQPGFYNHLPSPVVNVTVNVGNKQLAKVLGDGAMNSQSVRVATK